MAFQNWKKETEETRRKWKELTEFGGWCLSAHNLYMSLAMNPEPEQFKHWCEKAGIELDLPPWVPQ